MPQNKVPNQRTITVRKEPTDLQHIYTKNNLSAIDSAAYLLQSKSGFKLYMYLAKNQNNYSFNLSSADFCYWSNTGRTAYATAFNELIEKGFLLEKPDEKDTYIFCDKAKIPDNTVIIEYDNKKEFRF